MYGARTSWPFKWREPMQTVQRCPKCNARLIVTATEDRCPYCGYSKYKALAPMERTSSGIDMSLRNQIEDAIAGAEDEFGRPAEHFVGYEVPVENNFERYLFTLLFVVLLITLRIVWGGGYRYNILPLGAPAYVWYAIFLPSLLYLFTNHTTFMLIKPLTAIAGIAAAAVGVFALLQPGIVTGLWNSYTGPWLAYALLGYQVVAGLWAASLAWRDWRILSKG